MKKKIIVIREFSHLNTLLYTIHLFTLLKHSLCTGLGPKSVESLTH